MAVVESDFTNLHKLSKALYNDEPHREDRVAVRKEMWQFIGALFDRLYTSPDPDDGPVEVVDKTQLIWKPRIYWDPEPKNGDEPKFGSVRVIKDLENGVVELDKYPTKPSEYVSDPPTVGILLTGDIEHPLASIIINREFSVSSFAGPEISQQQRDVVKEALFALNYVEKWKTQVVEPQTALTLGD